MNIRPICVALLATLLFACADQEDPSNRRPKIAISILTDLSETWHNPQSDGRNKRVLSSVGEALMGAANRLPLPIAVRFHIVGVGSLGREPVCSALYRPSAFTVGKKADSTIRDRDQFARYVKDECPDLLLAKPVEPATEIAAAIITADRTLQLTREGVPRVFIILSDFKEESVTQYSFHGTDLTGSRFILVYRTLPEDQLDPAMQRAKIGNWKRRLSRLGAEVETLDENAVVTSPRDFEALIRTSSL